MQSAFYNTIDMNELQRNGASLAVSQRRRTCGFWQSSSTQWVGQRTDNSRLTGTTQQILGAKSHHSLQSWRRRILSADQYIATPT